MAEIAVITSLSHSLLSLTVGSTPALRLGRPIGQCSPRVFAVWGPFVPNCQRKCENVSTPKPQLCTLHDLQISCKCLGSGGTDGLFYLVPIIADATW